MASTLTAALTRGGLRRVLIVLCVTEIVSWGVLFYAFPVLAPGISATTGWSATMITAAFSLSQIMLALVGIWVGRLLDRWGPRPVMTFASVLAVPALVLVATARSLPWFFVGWFLVGIAMAGNLYSPAFAAVTRWWGDRRVTALTVITLIGGLASTVFGPLTALLAGWLDWRGTFLVLAAVHAVITIPLHFFGLRGPWPRAEEHPDQPAEPPAQVARSRRFVLLTIAFTLASFAIYGVVIIQVPLLLERGLSTGTAALALGLGGIGQVCARIGYGRLTRATSVRARTALVIGTGAISVALLGVLPGPAALLLAAAVLVGMARGVFTLLHATAITDRWGPAYYGRLNGILLAPINIVAALSPWLCTALAQALNGYPAVFLILTGFTAIATLLATFGGGR